MLFTVFTPAYNRSETLCRLYASLLCQTCQDFEWIIVDDGSTDSTGQMCERWSAEAPFPVIYQYQENGGKHTAVNRGVKLAAGEFFFIVDSDDYLPERSLEIIRAYCQQIRNEDSFAGVAGLRGREDGKPWMEWYSAKARMGGEDKTSLLQEDFIDATSFDYRYRMGACGDRAEVIKTDLLKAHPFPVYNGETYLNEDVLWSKLSAEGYLFRWFHHVVYITEYREDGLTRNIEKRQRESPRGVMNLANFLSAQKDIPLKERFRATYNYFRFGRLAQTAGMKLFRNCNNKLLAPLGLVAAIIRP